MSRTRVRLAPHDNGVATVLEITSRERKSVLSVVAETLFDLGIQIVRVESSVLATGLLERFELVEHDGQRLSAPRVATTGRAVQRALRASVPRRAVA